MTEPEINCTVELGFFQRRRFRLYLARKGLRYVETPFLLMSHFRYWAQSYAEAQATKFIANGCRYPI